MLEAFKVQIVHKTRKRGHHSRPYLRTMGTRMELDHRRWAVDAHAISTLFWPLKTVISEINCVACLVESYSILGNRIKSHYLAETLYLIRFCKKRVAGEKSREAQKTFTLM
jgi:hypothetical protein